LNDCCVDHPSAVDPTSGTNDPDMMQRDTGRRAVTRVRVAVWDASNDRPMSADERAVHSELEDVRQLVAAERVGPQR
jgi:hypothetical protein